MARTKFIEGYEGMYLITDEGEVYSCERMVENGRFTGKRKGKKLKQGRRGNKSKHGAKSDQYRFVRLSKNGESRSYSVHRLVAEAFIPNPDNLPEVNHKDEDPSNNRVDNLEWCTRQYNIEYSKGKMVQQIDNNGNVVAVYKSIKYASDITGIGRRNINNALCGWSSTAGGFTWKYVED